LDESENLLGLTNRNEVLARSLLQKHYRNSGAMGGLLQQQLNYPKKKKICRKKLNFSYVRHVETAMTYVETAMIVAQESKIASKKLFYFILIF